MVATDFTIITVLEQIHSVVLKKKVIIKFPGIFSAERPVQLGWTISKVCDRTVTSTREHRKIPRFMRVGHKDIGS